jgi:hypothetical protein
MQRLIYDNLNQKIINIIDLCDNTITGTPYDIFEGSPEEVQLEIKRLKLTATDG